MAKHTDEQIIEVRNIMHATRITADMIEGCMNSMRVCETEEELDILFISTIQYAEKLYTQNKRRLYVMGNPDFDKDHSVEL